MLSGALALAFSAAFTGAAAYINLVEQPARLGLDDRAMLKEWKPSDRRGFAMLAGLALAAGIVGFVTYQTSGDATWLVGAAFILASWPYLFFVVTPLNNRLLADVAVGGTLGSRGLVADWGVLEWGVTAIGLCASALFVWPLA